MIYHIITEVAWNEQQAADSIYVPSLQTEGFIHCCTQEQVAGVLIRYFKDQTGLLILTIDEQKLKSELKFEKSTNDELFPHVYGPINKSAILNVNRVSDK
ncbi:MAG: DUF952 domain-containing protein [Cyclobacteriaceae bacterium]|nr:DUF952 domain-containing protein [Cyclobacteriaceae bacterium]